MTSDPFTAFADAHAPLRQPRRVSTRQAKRQAEMVAERAQLFRLYRRQRKEDIGALLAGPYGAAAQILIDFLENTGPTSAPDLIERVQSGPWHVADRDTRALIFGLIDAALIQLRERAGLAPFDDPLPGEKTDVFLVIREMLS
jgi:hypothetical protein